MFRMGIALLEQQGNKKPYTSRSSLIQEVPIKWSHYGDVVFSQELGELWCNCDKAEPIKGFDLSCPLPLLLWDRPRAQLFSL